MALLALFTHWPAVATLIDSLYSTPRPRRPSRFVGADNYAQIAADPVFWQAFANNLWFALGTIPVSIALAMLMALWVNDRLIGRTAVRMAYFTPTVLPMIAVANIWLFFYTPQYGLWSRSPGAFGCPRATGSAHSDTALAAVTVVAIWKEPASS
jgi:sn-glycerol 3-phosphate transport system permease protein